MSAYSFDNLVPAQRALDAQRPASYTSDDARAARAEDSAKALAADCFVRAIQRGDAQAKLPLDSSARRADTMVYLLSSLSNNLAEMLFRACAQAKNSTAAPGTPERLAEDTAAAELLRNFVDAAAAEYADDNVEAWL